MNNNLCKACVTRQVLTNFKPPLNKRDVLATWSYEELLKTAPSCCVCRFILEIIGDKVDDAGTASSIFVMADGAPFDSTYQLTLYWRSLSLQRSVSISPTSSCLQIPPECISVVGRRVSQQVELDWLTAWLNSCDLAHSVCKDALGGRNATQSLSRIRLIDVRRRCLVDASLESEYLCLSYVWGGAALPKLTTNNHARYSGEMGIKESDMSDAQTIEDAIILVRRLGFQYLWVDALCIMQDDPHDISTFIPNMGLIYRDAALTIVSDSRSANTGIPGISKFRPNPSPVFSAHGYALVSLQNTLPEALTTSTWFSRGWTLQEMCFSKRILLFTDSQVFFRCGSTVHMEDGRREASRGAYADDRKLSLLSLERVEPNESISRPLALLDPASLRPRPLDREPRDIHRNRKSAGGNRQEVTYDWGHISAVRGTMGAFSRYKHLVQVYASRNLTYEHDIIKAFEGILGYLQQDLGPHIWGLPSRVFGNALLWHIEKPNRRRADFPSWSWCGWYMGPGSLLTHLESESPDSGPVNEMDSSLVRSANKSQDRKNGMTGPSRPKPAKVRFMQASKGVRTPQSSFIGPTVTDPRPSTAATAMDVSLSGKTRSSYTISVLARYITLGIRLNDSFYQGTDTLEVVEPTSRRKLADISLRPEWAGLSPRSIKLVTFLQLSYRKGRSMNRMQELQDGRPRTSGYKFEFPDVVIAMAVEKDSDDLWQRVQICEIDTKEWKSLQLFKAAVFLMK